MADEKFTWSELFVKGYPKKPGARKRAARFSTVFAVFFGLALVASLIDGSVFGTISAVLMLVLFGGMAIDLRRPADATGAD